jgi:hypothetical protein
MFKKKNKKAKREESNIELVLLRSVSNDFELSMIKSFLEEHEIPYIVRDHGVGGYMRIVTGSGTMFGSDILVEKSQLEQALNLLEELF